MTPPSSASPGRAYVVGAGVVGVCTALALARDGWQVTVLDPDGPAAGASFGNAGLVVPGAVTPVAMPGTLASVPRMLLDPEAALALRWPYLPRLLPWLVRFVLASRPSRVEAITRSLSTILGHVVEAHRALLERAGVADLLVRRGILVPYAETRNFERARPDLALRRRNGVRFEILDGGEIHQLVPALASGIRHAVLYPDGAHVLDPGGLVHALAAYLEREGGTMARERVLGFALDEDRVRAVRTDAGERACELVVVAAGAWSRPLAAALGCRVPLDTERGYHLMIPSPGIDVRVPMISGDWKFAITPMAGGLRAAGTVELGGLAAPPDPTRHDVIERHARRLLPDLHTEGASRWMGFRPSMPDSMPVIGRAGRRRNAWLAFGHGHLGLTMGPITGRVVADLAAGRRPPFEPAPFAATRF